MRSSPKGSHTVLTYTLIWVGSVSSPASTHIEYQVPGTKSYPTVWIGVPSPLTTLCSSIWFCEWRQWTQHESADDPVILPEGRVDGVAGPVADLVRDLPDGTLYESIVEDEQNLMLLRRLGAGGDGIEVEAVTIAKRPYDSWYRQQAGRVPVRLSESSLAAAVCEGYGHVWWLTQACSGP